MSDHGVSVGHRSDFQTNEQKIMDELDGLVNLVNNKKGKKSKRGGDMKSAREGAEAIREWVSLTDGAIALALKFYLVAFVDFKRDSNK